MRLKGYGILHFHLNSSLNSSDAEAMRRWGALLGYRTIYHNHNFTRLSAAVNTNSTDHIIRHLQDYNAQIAAGKKLCDYMSDELGCANPWLIPNITEPIVKPRNRSKRRKDEPLRLLYMDGLLKEKGIFDLIEALKSFVDTYETQLQLTVAGDGDLEAVNNAVAEAGLDKMVRFMGWVDGSTRDRLMRLNDIMIVTSHNDTIPMTVIEAGIYSMPVIVTRSGIIDEYFVEGISGLSVEIGRPDQISAAIKHYLDHPEDIPVHGIGGSKLAERCLPDKVVPLLEELYEKLQ